MRLLTNLKMMTTKTLKLNKRSASINGILPCNFVQLRPHYPEKRERKVRWKKELVEVRFYKPDASIKYFPASNLKVRWKKDLVEVRYYAGFIDDITCDIDVEMVDCFDETSTIDDITCDIDVEMVDCFDETSTNMDTSISQGDIDVEMVDCFDETSTNMDTSISQVDYHQKPPRRPITRSLSKRTRSGKLY